MVNQILHTQKKYSCLLELKEKAGSSQDPFVILESVKARRSVYRNKHPNSASEDLTDLEWSSEDASNASSDISLEPEEHLWSRKNHRRGDDVGRPRSWTIYVYNQKRRAGDAVWFRVWSNASDTFIEMEDNEILDFTRAVVERDSHFCLFVKMTGKGGFETVSVFDTKLIDRAMRSILDRAKHQKTIVLPSMEEIKREKKLEKKGKQGFWALLRSNAFGRSAGNQ